MEIPGRNGNTGDYRFGFQGQEVDSEVKGEGNSVNYKYRMHDPRLGRFFSTDPLESKYPMYSPYHFSSNQPIHAKELEGLESSNDLSPNAPGGKPYFRPDGPSPSGALDGPVGKTAIVLTGVAAIGTAGFVMGVEAFVLFVSNEVKDEVLSQVTGGASDVLDVSKQLKKE